MREPGGQDGNQIAETHGGIIVRELAVLEQVAGVRDEHLRFIEWSYVEEDHHLAEMILRPHRAGRPG
ncbi:MAG: hypothetical protein VX090_09110 [Pseudomonadota bacterium]|nr:hypothetical protein [Pseudomonadota bacterium]